MSSAKDKNCMETETGMISIVGLGNIGMNILQTFAQAGKKVLGVEVNASTVEKYLKRTEENLAGLVARGKMGTDERDDVIEKMRITDCLDDIEASTVVIEAIDEEMAAKTSLFRQIDGIVKQQCLLLSNTSSLSVTEMAACVSAPERFAGMHFFNPVPVMKLVEIVRGLQTSEATLAKIKTLAADIPRI